MSDDEKNTYEARPRSGKVSVGSMAGAALAAQNALWLAVRDLAAFHGGTPGPWLDDLQDRAIRETKNTVTSGVSIEAEAEMVQFGVDSLEAAFKAFRSRLVRASKKS